jgi:cellulose synthase/poly-beta-1,6-N-acetylglucosamine synthase-like glycosyltransferase/peptidoglycan/xylan/chitin deacetylase (PgdA/CDA1 family)/spore germination protein YaaH
MATPVFYDPQRKRWKRLRRIFDALGIGITLLIAFFIFTVVRGEQLPSLLLPQEKRPYHPVKETEKEKRAKQRKAARRKTRKAPTQIVFNSDEGVRAAFYVKWDAGSFSSLREYYPQIDLLFPEWLHVFTPDGRLQAITQANDVYDVVRNGAVQPVDTKVMPFLKAAKAETEVLPMVNNYDPIHNRWVAAVAQMMGEAAIRGRFRQQIAQFLATDKYRGLTLDFESFPTSAQPGYRALVGELNDDLHAKGMKLYVSVPAGDPDFDYKFVAAHSDGVILMDYDEHYLGGVPGPVASQQWFTDNLASALKTIPREKLICAIGAYGYDWLAPKRGQKPTAANAVVISAQKAWLTAQESEEQVTFDSDALNPHYAYLDDNDQRHDVWFLDGVTALNQMRAAQQLGIKTFALWRLGSEDRSLWSVWDVPGDAVAPGKLRHVPPGQEVDMEGDGEILRVGSRPSPGERKLTEDPASGLITDEEFAAVPTPYELDQYGSGPRQVAITFDDGPDPEWTPKILDVLKAKNVKAAFFLVGAQADKFGELTRRIFREGHEIGNHTFTHPDISMISEGHMRLELNLTERLFAGWLGVKPLLFRPPYSIDQEPDTADQVKPLELVQDMGYTTIGDKIDPNDWRDRPRRLSAEEITANVMKSLPPCAPDAEDCGNIILLHDGGGNRAETVRALPMIIDGLRQRGFEIVPVATLMGKSYADVMPAISAGERWSALVDALAFDLLQIIPWFIMIVFFVGDVLMTGRLLIVGLLAIYDRLRGRRTDTAAAAEFRPPVAVVIPAYNEEKVIERTVRAALDSDYPRLRVIVVDDGSKDATLEILHDAFAREEAQGRVLVLTKPNSGKADALNYALEHVQEEIFVGIDADTVIAPTAISRLVPHFLDARVAAVAGNAKVGNRVNLWTRWQALEYVTSQNFERRALNVFGAISVVPGAIGAWRTEAVREAGCYHHDTVAEDADLTMALLRRGYRVEYEDMALAYTEAPATARALMRQRFRWSFGILQSVWKHRQVIGRKGALGLLALPNIVVFQIVLPLLSPFIDLMFAFGALTYGVDRYFHPDTADPASFDKLVVFFVAFLVIDFIASAIAFALERREADRRENVLLLGHVWLQRFAYRQVFSLVLVKTLKRAIEGRSFAWDKLERTAEMPYAKVGR